LSNVIGRPIWDPWSISQSFSCAIMGSPIEFVDDARRLLIVARLQAAAPPRYLPIRLPRGDRRLWVERVSSDFRKTAIQIRRPNFLVRSERSAAIRSAAAVQPSYLLWPFWPIKRRSAPISLNFRLWLVAVLEV
jgi:hypothetical protein